jgi:predicted NBD/HSP70 family sugar kinase
VPGGGLAAGPGATDEVRRRNTALVLRVLRDSGGLSRADVARRAGLAKATVGSIVAQLMQAGAVAEGDPAPPEQQPLRGRPSTPLTLTGARLAGLGIELNVDYVAVTAVDLAGRELFAEEHALEGGAPTPGKLVALADRHLQQLHRQGVEVLGLTVAVPGLIDRSRGVVVEAPNLGWSDVGLADTLATALGGEVAVAVDNDANCAARAESLHGVAVGVQDFIYLTGTVGLGAGIVAGGEVLRGARGLAGEVGHLRVGDETHACACGRTGCWEALVGLRALVDATGIEVEPGEDPVAYAERLVHTAGTGPAIAQVGAALALGVAQLTATLDPQMVVLGGSFVPLGKVLVPAVERAIASAFTGAGATVALSELGLNAASVGAAIDALDDVYSGRRPVPVRS